MKTADVPDLMKSEPSAGVQKIQFTRVDDFTTFTAEYHLDRDVLVAHFFLPRPEKGALEAATESATPQEVEMAAAQAARTAGLLANNAEVRAYWTEKFPVALEKAVLSMVTKEQAKAAYTEEVSSWWLRMQVLSLDPIGFVRRVLARLDQELDSAGAPDLLGTSRKDT